MEELLEQGSLGCVGCGEEYFMSEVDKKEVSVGDVAVCSGCLTQNQVASENGVLIFARVDPEHLASFDFVSLQEANECAKEERSKREKRKVQHDEVQEEVDRSYATTLDVWNCARNKRGLTSAEFSKTLHGMNFLSEFAEVTKEVREAGFSVSEIPL